MDSFEGRGGGERARLTGRWRVCLYLHLNQLGSGLREGGGFVPQAQSCASGWQWKRNKFRGLPGGRGWEGLNASWSSSE